MTSRRGFLGLLASVPIAEVLAPQFATGGFVRGISGAKLETLSLKVDWDSPDPEAIERLRELMRAPTPWFEEAAPFSPEAWAALSVPNRLYGATINPQGEAI